jgi:carotenoid 1,2-hydratase
MNISTKIEDEFIDSDKPRKGYEWWYFDAISADKKWSIVLIFYQGNPFSTNYIEGKYTKKSEEYPAVSVSVYKNGKAEYYSFLEFPKSQFLYDDEDDIHLSIGGCAFHRKTLADTIEYELNLNQTLESSHSIVGKLKFISNRTSGSLIESVSKGDKHYWNLLQPRCKVVGSFKISGKTDAYHVGFHGDGYHDHNVGHEMMSESFKDWYWGRFHFPKYTIVNYIMNGYESKQHKAWLISRDNQELVGFFDKITLENQKKTLLGLESFRDINLSGLLGNLKIRNSRVLDNGPFYQRYLSEAEFTDVGGTQSAIGISEYIHPKRIEEEKFWWMVRMRLRYLREKPHWVQKSKMFYEWTW